MAGGINDFFEELFEPLGGVSLRRMFGGIGVFKDGLMFGLVDDDVLYLKADAVTGARYEAEGQERWSYDGRGKQVPLPYWRLPERLLDEPDEFRAWALEAFAVAVRNRAAKSKPAKRARKAAAKAKPKAKPKKKTAPKRR
jgi:DNA transformation protein